MNSFADEAKYDISNMPAAQIAQEYEEKRTDAWSVIEGLGIVKRIISVCKFDNYFPMHFAYEDLFVSEDGPGVACAGSARSNKSGAPRNSIVVFIVFQSEASSTTFSVYRI